jgi:hypothetical protein
MGILTCVRDPGISFENYINDEALQECISVIPKILVEENGMLRASGSPAARMQRLFQEMGARG